MVCATRKSSQNKCTSESATSWKTPTHTFTDIDLILRFFFFSFGLLFFFRVCRRIYGTLSYLMPLNKINKIGIYTAKRRFYREIVDWWNCFRIDFHLASFRLTSQNILLKSQKILKAFMEFWILCIFCMQRKQMNSRFEFEFMLCPTVLLNEVASNANYGKVIKLMEAWRFAYSIGGVACKQKSKYKY